MMAPEQIDHDNRENAAAAAKFHHVPYMIWPGDIEKWRAGESLPIPFPNLGDYVPNGYELDGAALFIDTSGFGETGEASLTQDQVFDRLEVGKAYAFTEVGLFQAYLQAYIKVTP